MFTDSNLAIMKRMLDYGGQVTCTQLAMKYGEDKNFYNSGSSSLARRMAFFISFVKRRQVGSEFAIYRNCEAVR